MANHYKILMIAVLFTACDACRKLPKAPQAHFELSADVEKSVLYLEEHEKGKFIIKIKPQNELAESVHYIVVSCKLPAGIKGNVLDATGEVITQGSKLSNGEHTLFYEPLNVGAHTLTLAITDQYGDSKKQVILTAILVKQSAKLPFKMALKADQKSIFIHQKANLTLALSSAGEQAASQAYTVKEVEVSTGALVFASSGEQLAAGSALTFGTQQLIFQPTAEMIFETLPVTIKITASNEKGDLSEATVVLELKPITFQVDTWFRQPTNEEGNLLEEAYSVLEIALTGVDEQLHEGPWKLIAWHCSDGVPRELVNSERAALTTFMLKCTETNRLYLKHPPLITGNSPQMYLTVEGPGKTLQKGVADLSSIQQATMATSIANLLDTVKQANEAAAAYLNTPVKEKCYAQQQAAKQAIESQLTQAQATAARLKEVYDKQGRALPQATEEAFHSIVTQEIPVLEEKQKKLEEEEEQAKLPFKAKLQAEERSIYQHQAAELILELAADLAKASSAAYTVRDITAPPGTLVLASSGEPLTIGSPLAFGTQRLLFQYTGAVRREKLLTPIKLTVSNELGDLSEATVVLELKPITFQVGTWLREPTNEECNLMEGECSVLELVLSGVNEELRDDTWKLTSWSFSDKVIRNLMNSQQEELTTFPLSIMEKNSLYLKLPPLITSNSPQMYLTVEGPGKTLRESVAKLSFNQATVAKSIKNLLDTVVKRSQEVDEYLNTPPREQHYDKLKALKQETEKWLSKLQEATGNIAQNYDIGSLPVATQEAFHSMVAQEIPALTRKQEKLDQEEELWDRAVSQLFFLDEEEVLESFIEAIYEPDRKGNLAIHEWAEGYCDDDEEASQFLIERTADINVKNNAGLTALHLAIIEAESAKRVEMLLKHGADPNIKDPDGKAPLLRALALAEYDMVSQLLKHGADPNAKWPDGETPLLHALQEEKYDMVSQLLKHGADPNAKWPDGETPLLHLIRDNQPRSVVSQLLEHGADPNVCMSRGGFSEYYDDLKNWTALHAAAEMADEEAAMLLLAYGARNSCACIRFPIGARDFKASQVALSSPITNGAEIRILIEGYQDAK